MANVLPWEPLYIFSLQWVYSRGLYILLDHQMPASLQNVILANMKEGKGFTTKKE